MKKAIFELTKAVNEKVDRLAEYESTPKEDQSSSHFEYIGDIAEDIQEYRRAIAVLKYFTMEDVLDELLKRREK